MAKESHKAQKTAAPAGESTPPESTGAGESSLNAGAAPAAAPASESTGAVKVSTAKQVDAQNKLIAKLEKDLHDAKIKQKTLLKAMSIDAEEEVPLHVLHAEMRKISKIASVCVLLCALFFFPCSGAEYAIYADANQSVSSTNGGDFYFENGDRFIGVNGTDPVSVFSGSVNKFNVFDN